MPQIDYTPENKVTTSSRTSNLLKLRVGETARAVMLEKTTFAWVHNLKAPKIDEDGKPVFEEKKRKGSDEKYRDYVMDFIGRPLCLGDYGVMKDKGVDPTNCPACKAAAEGGEVSRAERRFAVNLLRYGTKADGSLITPFTCTVVVWAFTEGNYDRLFNLTQEHGTLIGRDLLLGPCEAPEHYQRLKGISVGARDVWKLNDQIKALCVETFKSNREEGLEEKAIGRPVEFRWIQRDIEDIRARWAQVNGASETRVDDTAALDNAALTDGLADLLGTTAPPAAAPAAPPAAAQSIDLDDILRAGAAPAATAVAAPPAQAVVSAPPAPAQATAIDFADLLGDPSTPAPPPVVSAPPATTAPRQSTATSEFDDLLGSIGGI